MKSGNLTKAEQEQYKIIENSIADQRKDFETHQNAAEVQKYSDLCKSMGLKLSTTDGGISYLSENKKLIDINFDLCYVRHGKTEGNTEPRVFQGKVDYPENQLNDIGKKQAKEAAQKLKTEHPNWQPDLTVLSPLKRAIETASYSNKEPAVIIDESHEMAFGSWDNVKVVDIDPKCQAHLFYLDQNALVKAAEPHIVTSRSINEKLPAGTKVPAENFIDVIKRMREVLLSLNEHPIVKEVSSQRRPKILMFGHSMAGAATMILLGQGKLVEGTEKLGFDGKYIMPNATPYML